MPPEPPSAQNQELIDAMRLSMTVGVGPLTRRRLLERFGSARAVLEAAPSDLRNVEGVGPKLTDRIARAAQEIDVAAEIAVCQKHNVDILVETDPRYPRTLLEIPDPPGLLFVRGTLDKRDALSIGIVGTRHGTAYGLRQANRLAASLARAGLTIVSGLARGIDAAAHRGALEAGGRTLGVLGSGVLNIYPPEHVQLADEVIAHGALISEQPVRSSPLSGTFPQRNRIISGLSLGIIVVEAAERSGALITSRHAMEQGRDVFAVPGNVDSRASRGCHRLLRDGAILVESADDVLEHLGPLVEAMPRDDGTTVHHPAELLLNDIEDKVLQAVRGEATQIDEIVVQSGLPVPQVLATISVLEMRRLIRRLSGTTVIRL
jgi:DNA processing protein